LEEDEDMMSEGLATGGGDKEEEEKHCDKHNQPY
jgi:hypothetical protein